MVIGSWANGRYLDLEYRKMKKVQSLEEKGSQESLPSFPLEQVRYAGAKF
jgi:hypothetical protein